MSLRSIPHTNFIRNKSEKPEDKNTEFVNLLKWLYFRSLELYQNFSVK